jgi:hypothetical protein
LASTIISPQRTYVVDIIGLLSPSHIPFVSNEIRFRAKRTGIEVAAGFLYRADSMEEGFEEQYPKNDWPSERVLRFLASDRSNASVIDTLAITNATLRRVPYVRVNYTDLFVVLELEPAETLRLTAPRNSTGFISVQASPENSTKPLDAASDLFYEKAKPAQSIEVGVEMRESGISLAVRPTAK